jgi:hypothetical protein
MKEKYMNCPIPNARIAIIVVNGTSPSSVMAINTETAIAQLKIRNDKIHKPILRFFHAFEYMHGFQWGSKFSIL